MFQQTFIAKNVQIKTSLLKEKQVELYLKREDLIHPFVSGNKYRKLKYNIAEAKKKQHKSVLTFGGAFSNHILATASAAKENGLQSIGVIRGEELANNLEETLKTNFTLQKAHELGMEFYFIDRATYRDKSTLLFKEKLKSKFGDFYLVPEGGTNDLAIKGCEEIITENDIQFDFLTTCVGTGGTISGIINSSSETQTVLGFPALKGDFLENEIAQYVKKQNWKLVNNYHFGGYAKYNEELIHFINQFKTQFQIPLDPVYTGKMMFGLFDLIKNDYFRVGTKILAIHTGGLQGIKGFNSVLEKRGSELRIQ